MTFGLIFHAIDSRSSVIFRLFPIQYPVTVCESSPVHHVDISPSAAAGHKIAVTGASRVHIYDPATNELVKTLTKFKV